MSEEKIKYLEARVEALEIELEKKTNRLNKANNLLAELAKDMEVEYEQVK